MSEPAVPASAVPRVLLAHGGGGELMNELLSRHVFPALDNEWLSARTDGAVLPHADGKVVLTTDSYVVVPLEFPGGDIGRLAIAGTVNDLAVMGADPLAISLGLIIEEGLPLETLDRVVASVAATAGEAGVSVVTGDTKVIERRQGGTGDSADPRDGLFINTTGVGHLRPDARLDVARVEPGDAILINGPIAEHGLAVMSVRSGIEFESSLRSDAAPLNHLIARMLETGGDIKFLRDATRGGLAGVLADISEDRGVSVEIEEARIPVSRTARHAAEMLGLDPLTVANEGKVVCVVAAGDVDRVLEVMYGCPTGQHAVCIGIVTDSAPPLVELRTRAGGRRIVQRPYGEELPRIC